MTVSEASAIINRVRDENGFGLLEMLEIMTDEMESGGFSYWSETYSVQERTAYHVLIRGFREFFAPR